jgi:16S rRNA processing protein RimM
LPEGVYYHYQIIGLGVYTVDGDYLGKIMSIFETGSNDVYVVRGEDKEYLIPAIKDVIKEIDLEAKKMIVKLMEAEEA